MKIYVNGVEKASGNYTGTIPLHDSVSATIGGFRGNLNFEGLIDDIRIYDRELIPSDIKGIYNDGDGTEEIVDDYISFDDVVCDLEHTTIAFWMKRSVDDYESILGKGDGTYSLLEVDKVTNEFYFEPDVNNRAQTLASGITIDDDVWHHYVFVFDKLDATHNRIKLYVDGSLADTSTTSSPDQAFTQNFTFNKIGHQESQVTLIYGEYFKGSLDDIRIFDGVLSQNDIDLLYNSGKGTEVRTPSIKGNMLPNKGEYRKTKIGRMLSKRKRLINAGVIQ